MGKVATGLSLSLGGFIVGPNDGPGQPLVEGGVRLFEHLVGGPIELESTRVLEGAGVTHLTFRVVK